MSAFIPEGSYTKTSRNIESNLYCQAQKRDQSWICAGYNLTNSHAVNLENLDGFLVNESGEGKQNDYIPGGSYLKTSKGMQTILSAFCQKRDQTWQVSTLDITDLGMGQTLSNIDGVLTVD